MGISNFELIQVIGIILIIVGAVTGGTKELIYNVDTGKTDYRSEEDDSLKILKERYAKGEITKEEFEQKKKDLGYGEGDPPEGVSYKFA